MIFREGGRIYSVPRTFQRSCVYETLRTPIESAVLCISKSVLRKSRIVLRQWT